MKQSKQHTETEESSNAKRPEQFQSVWITFSDGVRAGFSGKAAAFPGDTRCIVNIEFTPPKPMPPGYTFEPIPI